MKTKINKNSIVKDNLKSLYWAFVCIVIPLIIGSSPMIPYVLTNNPLWFLLLPLTISICMVLASRLHSAGYVDKI